MKITQTGNRTLFDIRSFSEASGLSGKIEVPRTSTFIAVSVKYGGVNIWFGCFDGSSVIVPHLWFGQSNKPEVFPLPQGCHTISYRLEFVGSGEDIQATIILGGD